MKRFIIIVEVLICFGGMVCFPLESSAQNLSNSWSWHSEGEFKYPKDYKRSEEIFMEDVPAYVEVISNGKIQLCYWPLLGVWSTLADFPEEGEKSYVRGRVEIDCIWLHTEWENLLFESEDYVRRRGQP